MILEERACSKCGAVIYWIKTEKGKFMPVDVKKISLIDENGKVHQGYNPHWASCPFAASFRKKNAS